MSDPVRAYQALYGIVSRLAREYLTNTDTSGYYVGDLLGVILQKIGSLTGNGLGSFRAAQLAVGNQYLTEFTRSQSINIGKLLGSQEVIFDLNNCNANFNSDNNIQDIQVSWFPNTNFAAYKVCIAESRYRDVIYSTKNTTDTVPDHNDTPALQFGSSNNSYFNGGLTQYVAGTFNNTINISVETGRIVSVYVFGHMVDDINGERSPFPSTFLTFCTPERNGRVTIFIDKTREYIDTVHDPYTDVVSTPGIITYSRSGGISNDRDDNISQKYAVDYGLVNLGYCSGQTTDSPTNRIYNVTIGWGGNSKYSQYKVCWKSSVAYALSASEYGVFKTTDEDNNTDHILFRSNDCTGFTGNSGLLTDTNYTWESQSNDEVEIVFFIFGYTPEGIRSPFPEVAVRACVDDETVQDSKLSVIRTHLVDTTADGTLISFYNTKLGYSLSELEFKELSFISTLPEE